jgi:signal transduction histidine kinase
MIDAPEPKTRSLVDEYCLQLGILLERRTTQLALIASKEQAQRAAALAEEAMRQAQEADRAKTQFLANMTHELRTPLNAIIGFSEIIQAAARQADTAEHASYIRDAGVHLLGILNGVLDLARIEAGRLPLDEQAVSVEELFQAALRPVRGGAAEKRIATSCAGDLGRLVRIDPARLAQALTNLLSNAVAYTPEGGSVELAVATKPDGAWTISVRDTGPGIAADDIERVLKPFGQVGDHLTRETGGIGLGLPIASALVKLHGGALAISGEPGIGTTIEIRLPAARLEPKLPTAA